MRLKKTNKDSGARPCNRVNQDDAQIRAVM